MSNTPGLGSPAQFLGRTGIGIIKWAATVIIMFPLSYVLFPEFWGGPKVIYIVLAVIIATMIHFHR